MSKLLAFMFFLAVCGYSYNASAGVTFITDSHANTSKSILTGNGSSSGGNPGGTTSRDKCEAEGYTRTSCPTGLKSADRCPYSGSYFKTCCEAKYKYSREYCIKKGGSAGTECGGKYACD